MPTQIKQRNPPIHLLKQIDHITIETTEAKTLFTFFSEILHLPEAWPLASYGRFESGAIGLGNVNLEIITWADTEERDTPQTNQAILNGIAFEPAQPIATIEAELAKRKFPHPPPKPYLNQEGRLIWTTLSLDEALPNTFGFFICDYNFDNAERRKRLLSELQSKNGGALGLQKVEALILGLANFETTIHHWQSLLAPQQAKSKGIWPVGDGPQLHFEKADKNRVTILFKVASLAKAKDFLKAEGLLASISNNQIQIAPSKIQGLDIQLIE